MFRLSNFQAGWFPSCIKRGVAFVVLQAFLVAGHADYAAAADEDAKGQFLLVTGQPGTPAYAVSVGVSSLIKVRLTSSKGIDLNVVPTSGILEGLSLLRSGGAQFALMGANWKDVGLIDEDIQSVATLSKDGERSIQLLARRDMNADAVFEITKVTFENLEFLKNVGIDLETTSLDRALDDIFLPVHPGARRYFELFQALEPSSGDEAPATNVIASSNANSEPTTPRTSKGETFVIYFEFDDASISEEAAAVLDEVAALTDEDLRDTTVWMAGYTDTSGRQTYNEKLGQRRVDAVRDGLRARGFVAPKLFSSAFGERMTWVKTEDDTIEAANRRVEIFIEYHNNPSSPDAGNNLAATNAPDQQPAAEEVVTIEGAALGEAISDAVQVQDTQPTPSLQPKKSLAPLF